MRLLLFFYFLWLVAPVLSQDTLTFIASRGNALDMTGVQQGTYLLKIGGSNPMYKVMLIEDFISLILLSFILKPLS